MATQRRPTLENFIEKCNAYPPKVMAKMFKDEFKLTNSTPMKYDFDDRQKSWVQYVMPELKGLTRETIETINGSIRAKIACPMLTYGKVDQFHDVVKQYKRCMDLVDTNGYKSFEIRFSVNMIILSKEYTTNGDVNYIHEQRESVDLVCDRPEDFIDKYNDYIHGHIKLTEHQRLLITGYTMLIKLVPVVIEDVDDEEEKPWYNVYFEKFFTKYVLFRLCYVFLVIVAFPNITGIRFLPDYLIVPAQCYILVMAFCLRYIA